MTANWQVAAVVYAMLAAWIVPLLIWGRRKNRR